jgi:hypothetical protein
LKNTIPVEESALKSLEAEYRKSSMKFIEKVPIISALKQEIEKIKNKFVEKCEQSLENLLIENYNLSKSKTIAILKDSFEAIEDKILSSDKFH